MHHARPFGRPLCLAIGLLLAAWSAAPTRAQDAKAAVDLTIIAINDPADRTKRIKIPAGGAERMATLVKELRAHATHSVFVAAGDLIGASPLLSGMFADEPTIESLSAMGLELSAVGRSEERR